MDAPLDSTLVTVLVGLVMVAAAVGVFMAQRAGILQRRIAFIRSYVFPEELRASLAARHPEWPEARIDRVFEALREYFIACTLPHRHRIAHYVAMPSKAADEAWHEFLAMEREYRRFCDRAFGEFLRHVPRDKMDEPPERALANTLYLLRVRPIGLAATAAGFPLLFALDHELGLPEGNVYDAAALKRLETFAAALRAARKGTSPPAPMAAMFKPPCAAAGTDSAGGVADFEVD